MKSLISTVLVISAILGTLFYFKNTNHIVTSHSFNKEYKINKIDFHNYSTGGRFNREREFHALELKEENKEEVYLKLTNYNFVQSDVKNIKVSLNLLTLQDDEIKNCVSKIELDGKTTDFTIYTLDEQNSTFVYCNNLYTKQEYADLLKSLNPALKERIETTLIKQ